MLAVECDETRIDFRQRTRYVDAKARSLDEALHIIHVAHQKGEAISVGLLGNAAEVFPEIARRVKAGDIKSRPDVVTDQTSAHDPLNGYLPLGWTMEMAASARLAEPARVVKEAKQSMAIHVRAMLDLHAAGIPTLDYGNNIRQVAKDEGVANAFDFPGFVPAYIRPLFCRGVGPRHRD